MVLTEIVFQSVQPTCTIPCCPTTHQQYTNNQQQTEQHRNIYMNFTLENFAIIFSHSSGVVALHKICDSDKL